MRLLGALAEFGTVVCVQLADPALLNPNKIYVCCISAGLGVASNGPKIMRYWIDPNHIILQLEAFL